MKKIDIIGKKFGRLEPLYESSKDTKNRQKWMCKCDCGNLVEVSKYKLLAGVKKSCGCLYKEVLNNFKLDKFVDVKDQRFGLLIARYPIGKKDKRSETIWRCDCDCGNTFDIDIVSLRKNKYPSCGCKDSPQNKEGCFDKRRQLFKKITGLSTSILLENKELQEKLCDSLIKKWNKFGYAKQANRNVEIFRKRYLTIMPITLNEIGQELGIARERVRQIEKKNLQFIEKMLSV